MMPRALALSAAALLLGTGSLAGQSRGGSRFRIMPGAHYQSIQRLTGALSLLFVTELHPAGARGIQLGAEAGQGGGKIRLGVANWGSGSGAFMGVAMLRTWDKPHRVAVDQTFVGPELRVTAYFLAGTLGYYWRTNGSAPGDSRTLNFGAGVLF